MIIVYRQKYFDQNTIRPFHFLRIFSNESTLQIIYQSIDSDKSRLRFCLLEWIGQFLLGNILLLFKPRKLFFFLLFMVAIPKGWKSSLFGQFTHISMYIKVVRMHFYKLELQQFNILIVFVHLVSLLNQSDELGEMSQVP